MNHFEYIQNKTQIQQSDVLNTILGALGRNGENANLGLDPIREIGSFADININTLAAAVDLQRYHESSTTESMRQRNNNNVGFILLVFLLQKSSI